MAKINVSPVSRINKAGLAAAVCAALLAGCATTQNEALKSAEQTYASVSSDASVKANEQAAEHLKTSEAALAKAKHNDNLATLFGAGSAKDTSNQAYIAEQEAKTAAAIAASANADQELAMLQKDLQVAQVAKEEREAAERARQAELAAAEARKDELAAALERAQRRGADVVETAEMIKVTFPNRVTFDTNKAELKPELTEDLNELAKTLKDKYPNAKLAIRGHTDSTGPEEYNKQLSEKRAIAVKTFLLDQGMPSERVASEGIGEAEPVAENNTPAGRAANRRVELIITGHQPE